MLLTTCPADREAPRRHRGAGRFALVLVASITTGLVSSGCGSNSPGPASDVEAIIATATPGADGVQQITVAGDAQLRFSPSVIKAKAGKLRITLRTIGGTPHDLEVRPAKINTGIVSKDREKSIVVTLTPGSYDFVCTFHIASNMVGVIDVT